MDHDSIQEGARSSLSLKRLELAGAPVALDNEPFVLGMLDDACVEELTHQVGGHLAGLVLLLQS